MRVHVAPAGDCDCGLYAFHPWAREARLTACRAATGRRSAWIHGVVAASGRMEVHASGIRAERMRPVALFDHGGDPTRTLWMRALAERYEAELVEVPDFAAYDAYVESELTPLSRETVEELLTDDLELVLTPAMEISDDDEAVAGSGFSVGTRDIAGAGRPESQGPGATVLKVRGVSYRDAELQRPEFEPGSTVQLIPEPGNPHDPNAVGIWDAAGSVQVGYVPREQARSVRRSLDAGRVKRALVVWQWRRMRTGRRAGLMVLISRTERILVRVGACGDSDHCVSLEDHVLGL